MGAARIGNRLARFGRWNPGRKHIAGTDVTAAMQHQYERILASLRRRHKYGGDVKRKSVAAATARLLAENPSGGLAAARRLAEKFHGRPAEQDLEVTEREQYEEFGAVLGYLCELRILDPDGNHETPISFMCDEDRADRNILVMGNPEGTNIEFVGGDQSFDWWKVQGASKDKEKHFALVGPVTEITYWADKHHLGEPKEQEQGIEYYHRFGKEDPNDPEAPPIVDDPNEIPWLVYDTMNDRMLFVGGNYTIEPEGITG